MLLPVIAPKPQRLLSPRLDFIEEKKLNSFDFHGVEVRETLTPESHEACREVERIMHAEALPDAELEQKSPYRPKLSYPRFESIDSPPLRSISPPARAPNPQAVAVEAYWREQSDPVGTEYTLQPDIDSDRDKDDDEDDPEIQLYPHSIPLSAQFHNSLAALASPFSAPPALPSLELSRHYSLPEASTPQNQGTEDEGEILEIDDSILLSPNFQNSQDEDETDSFSPLLTDSSPYHLPVVNSLRRRSFVADEDDRDEEETYQSPHSTPTNRSRPIDIPIINRYQSLPSRISSSYTTTIETLDKTPTPSVSNSSKRKRGKIRYASRSLPSEGSVGYPKQLRKAGRKTH